MAEEIFQVLIAQLLHEHPQYTENAGLGHCGAACLSLIELLKKNRIKKYTIITCYDFASTPEGQTAFNNHLSCQFQKVAKLNFGQEVEIEMVKRQFRSKKVDIGHIVLLVDSWVLDPTAKQHGQPYVYTADRLNKVWERFVFATDIVHYANLGVYELVGTMPIDRSAYLPTLASPICYLHE